MTSVIIALSVISRNLYERRNQKITKHKDEAEYRKEGPA